MECKTCGNQIETEAIELEIRGQLNLSAEPQYCYRCRLEKRYSKSTKFQFDKTDCVYCGENIVTASPFLGKRPIACEKCYQNKFLDSVN